MLVFAVCLVPSRDVEGILVFLHADKVIHFVMFAALGILVGMAVHARRFMVGAVWVTVCAMASELLQALVPSRDASIYDLIADLAGGMVALSIMRFLIPAARDTATADDSPPV